MEIFGNNTSVRGCFAKAKLKIESGRGAYLRLPDGSELPNSLSDPLLVIGFNYIQKDSVQITKTFGNTVHGYTFGHDPLNSIMQVSFLGFLSNDTGLINRFNSAYEGARISKSFKPAVLSIGTKGDRLVGYVVAMNSDTRDHIHGIQHFTLDMMLLTPQVNKEAAKAKAQTVAQPKVILYGVQTTLPSQA